MRRIVHSDRIIGSFRLAGARMHRSNATDGGFEILESGERFPTFERRTGRGHVGLGIMDVSPGPTESRRYLWMGSAGFFHFHQQFS